MNIDDLREEFKQYDGPEDMAAFGQLTDVDPERGSATLVHLYRRDRSNPVRFDDATKDDVIKLQQKTVRVAGHGWWDEDDNWVMIAIEQVEYPAFGNRYVRGPVNWAEVPRARVPFTEEESKEFDELLYRLRHPGAP